MEKDQDDTSGRKMTMAPIGESEDPRGFVIEDLEASNPNYVSAWEVFLLIHMMAMMRGTMMIYAFFRNTSIAIGCVDTLDQGPAGAGALAETIPLKLFYDIIKLKSMTTMNHCQ